MIQSLRPVFLSVLLFAMVFQASAQSNPKDSAYVMALFKRAPVQTDPNAAIPYIDSIIEYSHQHRFLKGEAFGYRQKMAIYMHTQQTAKAEAYIKKAIAFSQRNDMPKTVADVLLAASAFHNEQSNYVQGFKDATQALEVARKAGEPEFVGRAYLQIGHCYDEKQDYAKAADYFQKAIDQLQKINKIPQLRDAMSAMAAMDVNRAHYADALKRFKQVEQSAPQVPFDPFKLPHLYGNMALCYHELGDRKQAIAYYLKTLEITEQLGPGLKVADVATRVLVGQLYTETRDFTQSEHYLNQALTGALEMQNVEQLQSVYQKLSTLFKEKGDFRKAYDYRVLHQQYADSVLNEEKAKALEDLSVHYQTDEVTRQNKLLALEKAYAQQEAERKNFWLIGLSLAVLLLVLVGYFYYRNTKQKQAISKLERDQIKQKLLITQMNPHFIFNSIENIQGLIYEEKDDLAIDYLNKFSALTRQILEHSNENYISLEDETAMIQNYLAIQQLLYGNKFDYTLHIDPSLEPEAVFLPPMLTQPFIENAIKHGLANKAERGKIDIRFFREGEKLLFEVLDNGKGFGNEAKTGQHKSLAMTITKERLIGYSKNVDFVVQTGNIMDGSTVVGARVVFEIPYLYEN